jgi:hypothetical protein
MYPEFRCTVSCSAPFTTDTFCGCHMFELYAGRLGSGGAATVGGSGWLLVIQGRPKHSTVVGLVIPRQVRSVDMDLSS